MSRNPNDLDQPSSSRNQERLPPTPSEIDASGRNSNGRNIRFFEIGRPKAKQETRQAEIHPSPSNPINHLPVAAESPVITTASSDADIPTRYLRRSRVPSHLSCLPENLSWTAGFLLAGVGAGLAILGEGIINPPQMKDMGETHIIGWNRFFYSLCFLLSLALLSVSYCCLVRKERDEQRKSLLSHQSSTHLTCLPENLSWAAGFLVAGAGFGQMLLIEYINHQQMKDMQKTHIVGWDRLIYGLCFALALTTLVVNYVYSLRKAKKEENRLNGPHI